jgi:hypothetical protein
MTWARMPAEGYYESIPGSSLVLNSTNFGWQTWDVTQMLQDEINANKLDFSMEAIELNLIGACD